MPNVIDEREVRTFAWAVCGAAAAYEADQRRATETLQEFGFALDAVAYEHYMGGTVRAIMATGPREYGRVKMVAFRGTNTALQLFEEVEQACLHPLGIPNAYNGRSTRVSTYFWGAYQKLLPHILSYVSTKQSYLLTGHSLGGAIASIAAIDLAHAKVPVWECTSSRLVTFGQPRVGCAEFAKAHDELVAPYHKFRLINNMDPVPHLPKWPTAYHHSREIWMTYDESRRALGYWKVCGEGDTRDGSNTYGWRTISFGDHAVTAYQAKLHESWTNVRELSDAQHAVINRAVPQ